ncbi:MAG: tail fiber domain-containing protein [Deltaproteobacteria bacterium]|nr:tail fiber domain-containing protein [Deltaproteobacteria bacterium]
MCCSGVPYPSEGICQADCPAVSDREQKEAIVVVDSNDVLERLSRLPISEWSYREEAGSVRHVGPMAQDFHREFGLGADNRHIHPVDAAGVTMAALQALTERVEALGRENEALRESNVRLHERVEDLSCR